MWIRIEDSNVMVNTSKVISISQVDDGDGLSHVEIQAVDGKVITALKGVPTEKVVENMKAFNKAVMKGDLTFNFRPAGRIPRDRDNHENNDDQE